MKGNSIPISAFTHFQSDKNAGLQNQALATKSKSDGISVNKDKSMPHCARAPIPEFLALAGERYGDKGAMAANIIADAGDRLPIRHKSIPR